jgi:hypothetical protein
VAIIELLFPSIPGVISLFPSRPSNGATTFLSFNDAIIEPYFIICCLLKSIDFIISSFLILIEKDLLAIAVPKVSIL